MTITIGVWVTPFLITISSILIAFIKAKKSASDGVYSALVDTIHLGLNLTLALVVSLVSWVAFVVYLYY